MTVTIRHGDCREVLRTLPDESVHCCVTSPPYWGLRDYGVEGQIGLEPSPERYVNELVAVFEEVRRVLRSDGTFWLNIQDGYSAGLFTGGGSWGAKPEWQTIINRRGFKGAPDGWKRKELLGVPALLSAALSASGWYLRSEIIWAKPTASEPPRIDRPAKAHEYVFLFSKSDRYAYERHEGVALTVWQITAGTDAAGHIAAMPPELAERCIKAGCPVGGTVLDPFGGAGTTGMVADRLQRDAILIELNPEYAGIAERRIRGDGGMFAEVSA